MAKLPKKAAVATPASAPSYRWEFLAASAGTGKTEKIQTLLLERLLAGGQSAEAVMQRSLLVSFTEAAAAELRSRIQNTLAHVIDVIRNGKAKGITFRNQQVTDVVHASPFTDPDKVEQLMAAQASIDQLTVGTIHSLCKRLINKYPIESNARTGLVIASDLTEVADEAAADVYAELVRLYDSHGQWRPGLGDETGFLSNPSKNLKQPTARRLMKLAKSVVESELPIHPAQPALLTPSGTLSTDYADIVTWFAHQVRARLRIRTQRLGLISLADLIRIVDEALQQKPSPLALKLQNEFDFIILDEAQDTDAAQWRILQTLAGTHAEFFAVGDPKQSIFSFRGAHYESIPPLQKSSTSNWKQGAPLIHNYRSDKPLLVSLNTFYGNGALPFFTAVQPRQPCRLHHGKVDAANERSGLYFHVAQPPAAGSFEVSHTWDAVADAIVEELDAGLAVGATDSEQRSLTPGDVAVLVRYNRSAEAIRGALVKRGVPVAAASQSSVLDSDELRELAAVFAAIAAPFDERLVHAAAMTRIIGFDNAALNKMIVQGDGSLDRQQLVERLVKLREVLALKGIAAAMEGVIDHAWPPSGISARERMLQEDDGERAMKNIADITAVLIDAFWRRDAVGGSSLGVSAWLLKAAARSTARELGGEEDDSFSVSLETDADAVRVMTIHAAKGRQFGCVWLPEACSVFSGNGNRYKDYGQAWRLAIGGEILLAPSADPKAAKAEAIEDSIHEELRLLYVAGTRARHRTHIVVGCFDPPATQPRLPLGHLLMERKPTKFNDNPPAWLKRGCEKDLESHLTRIKKAAASAGGVVEILPLLSPTGLMFSHKPCATPALPAGVLDVPRPMRQSSFSSLSKYAQFGATVEDHADEFADSSDDDDVARRVRPVDEPSDATSDDPGDVASPPGAAAGTPLTISRSVLRGGKKYGNFVHDVLEFMLPLPEIYSPQDVAAIINSVAKRDGIQGVPKIGEELAVHLLEALGQPLGGPGFDNLSLLDLAHHGTVTTELPFTIALDVERKEAHADLHEIFATHGFGDFQGFADLVENLKRTDARGIFTGLIDLIWRSDDGTRVAIVDYKTNVLPKSGKPCLEAYSRRKLAAEMASSRYLLQAVLYAAVVDTWMQQADPNWDYGKQFAGVSFTFLRAMGRHNPAGKEDNAVFHVNVPKSLARGLAAALNIRVRSTAPAFAGASIP